MICEAFGPTTRFSVAAVCPGWLKMTLSPGALLKSAQLITALFVV